MADFSGTFNQAAWLALLTLPLCMQPAQASAGLTEPLSDVALSEVRGAFGDNLLGPLLSAQLNGQWSGTLAAEHAASGGAEAAALQALQGGAFGVFGAQHGPQLNAEALLRSAERTLKPAGLALPSLALALPVLALLPMMPILPVLALPGLLPPKSCSAAKPC